jgi:ferrochelatase
MPRIAVVLMNLGGPDSLEAVQPFLFSLFSDPAVIGLPAWLRTPLAKLVAARRTPTAQKIYAQLGGGSPLLANTMAQARALEAALGCGNRCFIAMRHWHPSSADAADEVANWQPDEVVCLPLFPQFSTTTTASSLAAWRVAAERRGLDRPMHVVCCYPGEKGFVEAIAGLIRRVLDVADPPVRLLLTAHGLPERIVRAGDPYQGQVEQTARAVVASLGESRLDWSVCYQSRVGPLKWIGPATDEEIRRAGRDEVALVVAPISFVSEHSETLVELDRDYRRLAEMSGVPAYHRVSTVGVEPLFIEALASLVRRAHSNGHVGTCLHGDVRRGPGPCGAAI